MRTGVVGATPTAPGTAAGATSTAASKCPTSASGKGVSATKLKVAFAFGASAGAASNAALGVATAEEQRAAYEVVIKSVNASGGIACRQIDPVYVTANPTDQSDLQAKCLDIVNAGAFAVIDFGAYASFPQKQCFAQHQIPYFGGFFQGADEQAKFYPYLFSMNQYELLYRNTVFALRDRGFFDPAKGFKKLGFVYRSCRASLVTLVADSLREAGVADPVSYNLGCPSTFATPSDILQAVLKFKNAGVTHVVPVDFVADAGNFTKVAEQQGFRPLYGFGDDGVLSIQGILSPEPNNIANALIVTTGRVGEERTPGRSPTPATQRCDAIYRAAGRPPTWKQNVVAGTACDQLWMFQAAVEHAPALRADALADGLHRAGTVDFGYPFGPNDFTGSRVTTAGQFWQVQQFETGCRCWQLVDKDFHPSFR